MLEFRINISEKRRKVVDDFLVSLNIKFRYLEYSSFSDPNEKIIEWLFLIDKDYSDGIIENLNKLGIGTIYGQFSYTQVDYFSSSEISRPNLNRSDITSYEKIMYDHSRFKFGLYFILIGICGAILASFGIASQNLLIIVGAQIIAPFLQPIALTSLGLMSPEKKNFRIGLKAEVIIIFVTILFGFLSGLIIIIINLFTGGFKSTSLLLNPCTNEEIFLLMQVDLPSVVLAIFSGLAAGIIIINKYGESVVGVAVSSSLNPPATNIGLLMSTSQLAVFFPSILYIGSGIDYNNKFIVNELLFMLLFAIAFFLLNLCIIHTTITIVFWLSGFATHSGISQRRKGYFLRKNLIFIFILSFVTFLFLFIFNPQFLDSVCK
jgi:uncharacterized membrane protein